MLNEQHRMDVLSNNMANVTTVGYKKEGTTSQSFDEVLDLKIKDSTVGYRLAQREGYNSRGVKIGENYVDWSQGSFRITDNTFDLALSDRGFFAVEFTNKAGETSTMYTRAGEFELNTQGYLVTHEGDYVLDENNCLQGGEYDYITALEPDEKNFRKLLKNTEELFNISCLNMGAWDKHDTLIFDTQAGRNAKLSSKGKSVEVIDVDSLELSPTFIKMDIEGAELKALSGLEKTIKKYTPKLYVCAYHRNEDLFSLPIKVLELNPDYKVYFRHSKYIPAWESNFYFV